MKHKVAKRYTSDTKTAQHGIPSTAHLLGHRLRELRNQQEMTQAELAESAGLSDNFIALIERGKTAPSLQTLQTLAHALDVQIAELFAFNSKPTAKNNKADKSIHKLLRKYSPSEIKTLLKIGKLIEKMSR